MKPVRFIVSLVVSAAVVGIAVSGEKGETTGPRLRPKTPAAERLVFATFAEDAASLEHALYLAESLRTFGGGLREAPVRIYAPKDLLEAQPAIAGRIAALRADLRTSAAPEDALPYPFARKVFAAAQAESDEKGRAAILAWMDEDTIILEEPRDFLLPEGFALGYRPVMHRRIGSRFGDPPDPFWSRVYEKLSVPESAIFPVVTPADGEKVRAYFNAGLLVVRPERGILRRWARDFPRLYRDPVFAEWCRQDRLKLIFLHQAALAGTILSGLKRQEMVDLGPRYNFPLFFKEMFGARREFDSIAGVTTLRYDIYFQNAATDWAERLKGPPEKIAWLKARLGRK